MDLASSGSGDTIYTVIAAVLGSFVSGIVLILIHHHNVKQEIEKHRGMELFDRKQKVYRSLLTQMGKIVDHSTVLGEDPNWRIGRDVYNELLISGDKSVIDAFNQFIVNFDKVTDQKATELVKNVWIAIRKDLYRKDDLSPEQMKIFGPSASTKLAFEILAKYIDILEPLGLVNLESIAKMDIEQTHKISGISKDELKKMKDGVEKEFRVRSEWNRFKEE